MASSSSWMPTTGEQGAPGDQVGPWDAWSRATGRYAGQHETSTSQRGVPAEAYGEGQPTSTRHGGDPLPPQEGHPVGPRRWGNAETPSQSQPISEDLAQTPPPTRETAHDEPRHRPGQAARGALRTDSSPALESAHAGSLDGSEWAPGPAWWDQLARSSSTEHPEAGAEALIPPPSAEPPASTEVAPASDTPTLASSLTEAPSRTAISAAPEMPASPAREPGREEATPSDQGVRNEGPGALPWHRRAARGIASFLGSAYSRQDAPPLGSRAGVTDGADGPAGSSSPQPAANPVPAPEHTQPRVSPGQEPVRPQPLDAPQPSQHQRRADDTELGPPPGVVPMDARVLETVRIPDARSWIADNRWTDWDAFWKANEPTARTYEQKWVPAISWPPHGLSFPDLYPYLQELPPWHVIQQWTRPHTLRGGAPQPPDVIRLFLGALTAHLAAHFRKGPISTPVTGGEMSRRDRPVVFATARITVREVPDLGVCWLVPVEGAVPRTDAGMTPEDRAEASDGIGIHATSPAGLMAILADAQVRPQASGHPAYTDPSGIYAQGYQNADFTDPADVSDKYELCLQKASCHKNTCGVAVQVNFRAAKTVVKEGGTETEAEKVRPGRCTRLKGSQRFCIAADNAQIQKLIFFPCFLEWIFARCFWPQAPQDGEPPQVKRPLSNPYTASFLGGPRVGDPARFGPESSSDSAKAPRVSKETPAQVAPAPPPPTPAKEQGESAVPASQQQGVERGPATWASQPGQQAPPRIPARRADIGLWQQLEEWAQTHAPELRYPPADRRLPPDAQHSLETALAKPLRWYQDQYFYTPHGQPWFQNPWHKDFVYPEREQAYCGPLKNKWRSDPRFQAIYKRETGRDLPPLEEGDSWSWSREHKWGASATGDAPTAAQTEPDQWASAGCNDNGGGPAVDSQSGGASGGPGQGCQVQDASDVPPSPTPVPRQHLRPAVTPPGSCHHGSPQAEVPTPEHRPASRSGTPEIYVLPQTPPAQPMAFGSVQPAFAPGGAWRLAHEDPAAISQAQQVYLATQAMQSSAVFLGLVSQGNEVARSHGRMVEMLFQAAGGQVHGPPELMLPGPQYTQMAYQGGPRVMPGPGLGMAPPPAPPLPLAQVQPAPPGLWHSPARPKTHGPHRQSGQRRGGDMGVDPAHRPQPLPPQEASSHYHTELEGGAHADMPAGPQGRAPPAQGGGTPGPPQPQEPDLYQKAQAIGKAVPAVGNRLSVTHKHSLETAVAAKRMWFQDACSVWWPNPWENPDGEVPKSGSSAQPTPPHQAHGGHEDPLYSSEGDPWGRQPVSARQDESTPSGSGSRGLHKTLPAWVKPGTVSLAAAHALPTADAAAHGPPHLARAFSGVSLGCVLLVALALLVAIGLWRWARRNPLLAGSCPGCAVRGSPCLNSRYAACRSLLAAWKVSSHTGGVASSMSRPTLPTMRGSRSRALLLTLALVVVTFGAHPVDGALEAGRPFTGLKADLPILDTVWPRWDATDRDGWEAVEPWMSPDSACLFPAPDLCSWPGTALSFCGDDATLSMTWAMDCSLEGANTTALPSRDEGSPAWDVVARACLEWPLLWLSPDSACLLPAPGRGPGLIPTAVALLVGGGCALCALRRDVTRRKQTRDLPSLTRPQGPRPRCTRFVVVLLVLVALPSLCFTSPPVPRWHSVPADSWLATGSRGMVALAVHISTQQCLWRLRGTRKSRNKRMHALHGNGPASPSPADLQTTLTGASGSRSPVAQPPGGETNLQRRIREGRQHEEGWRAGPW